MAKDAGQSRGIYLICFEESDVFSGQLIPLLHSINAHRTNHMGQSQ